MRKKTTNCRRHMLGRMSREADINRNRRDNEDIILNAMSNYCTFTSIQRRIEKDISALVK